MKIALIIAVYKRHDLTKIALDNFRAQSKKYGFEIIVAGSEGNVSRQLANGCHYIEVPNQPLSDKHNAMVNKAKELNVDGIVLMGSDDIVSDSYFDWVYSLDKDSDKLHGLKDFYFYSTQTHSLHYWGGYKQGKQIAGAGRFFSRAVLDKLSWQLWDSGLYKGLDTCTSNKLKSNGIKEIPVSMESISAFMVDVKHTFSITSLDIIGNCQESNIEIMEKKVRKPAVKKVQELKNEPQTAKKIYSSNEVVNFVANGKSKHLVAGKVYELDGAKANILIAKGYGEAE